MKAQGVWGPGSLLLGLAELLIAALEHLGEQPQGHDAVDGHL